MDHTHDAGEVEFPDGRVETLSFPDEVIDAVIAQALAVREADSRFLLDQLAAINAGRNPDAEHRPPPEGLSGRVRPVPHRHVRPLARRRHCRRDRARLPRQGRHQHGRFPARRQRHRRLRPAVPTAGQRQGGPEDPSWDEFWNNQRGWKRELVLAGSTHASFTDYEVLYPQAGPVVGLTTEQVTQVIGTLDPLRAVRVERAHVRAFFDLHLRHQDDHLFDGASTPYPEIRLVR